MFNSLTKTSTCWVPGLVGAICAVIAAIPPDRAEACSPPLPSCSRSLGFLQNDPTDVPTNARLELGISCFDLQRPPLEQMAPDLKTAAGDPVEGTWVDLGTRIRWEGVLAPGTAYVLEDTWGTFCSDETFGGPDPQCVDSSVAEGTVVPLATFGTASGPDETPPPAPEAPTFACDELHTRDEESFCGFSEAQDDWWADVHFPTPPSADTVKQHLFWRREGEDYDFDFPGGGTRRTDAIGARPGHWRVVVVAEDRAGNLSAPSAEASLDFPDACDFKQRFPVKYTHPPLTGDPGCTSAGGTSLALPLLLTVGLLASRRRGRA